MPASPRLPARIQTRYDVLEFFSYLDLVDGTSFHPDDRFLAEDGVTVNYVTAEGDPSYTVPEARRRDRLMSQAFEVARQNGLDIYELAIWATSREPQVMPRWARTTISQWRHLLPAPTSASRKHWEV